MQASTKKYDLDRVSRLLITVSSIVLCVVLINYLSPVLWPFLLGFILAYMLDPVVRFFQRLLHVKGRLLPVVITLIIVAAVTFAACYLLLPHLFEEFARIAKLLTTYAKTSIHIPYLPDSMLDFLRSNIDVNNLSHLLTRDEWIELISGTWDVVDGTMSVVWSIVSSLIVLLYMVFVLLDFDKLSRAFKAAIPHRYRYTALHVLDDVTNTMSRYFRGQALVSLFVGIIFAIEFHFIGLPMAIAFGLFI